MTQLSNPRFWILDRLPVELKIVVCSQLCAHCTGTTCEYPSRNLTELQENLDTLSSLSKTCRLLRNVAQPILHHHFPFRRGYAITHLYLFIRTLTTRPDLASDVCMLSLECRLDPLYKPATLRNRYIARNDLDFEQVVQAATPFSLKPPGEWCPSLPPSRWLSSKAFEFLAPLAIYLCKNSQAIDLYQPLPLRVLRKTFRHFKKQHPLVNIERLCLSFSSLRWPGFNPGVLEDLNEYMPNLRTLQFYSVHTMDESDSIFHRWDLSLLTRIDIIACRFPDDTIAMLLSSCSHLTDYTYISGFENRLDLREPVTKIIHDSCPKLHRTLRRLVLDDIGDSRCKPVYTSIQSLVALEEVHLWAIGLFSWRTAQISLPKSLQSEPEPLSRILPSSLTSLNILATENWIKQSSDLIVEFLEDIIQLRRAPFPNLRTIHIWVNTQIHTPQEAKMMFLWDHVRIDGLATAVGIKVSLEPAQLPPSIAMLRYPIKDQSGRWEY
jgi:hypothetical protein